VSIYGAATKNQRRYRHRRVGIFCFHLNCFMKQIEGELGKYSKPKLGASTFTHEKIMGSGVCSQGDKRRACTDPAFNKEAQKLQQDSMRMPPRF
jgi:hypothetical protein